MMLELKFTILALARFTIYSFIVPATVITIVNYNLTVIMIINYDRKTFIAQATGFERAIWENGKLWKFSFSFFQKKCKFVNRRHGTPTFVVEMPWLLVEKKTPTTANPPPNLALIYWPTPGNPYWRGRLSTVDLLVLTSLDQLPSIWKFYLPFLQRKEVNCTEPLSSVSVPCLLAYFPFAHLAGCAVW